MDNKQNEELQSRREFFKKAAKAALPVVGAVVMASLPIRQAEAATNCLGCQIMCSKDCTNYCTGGCKNSCKNLCTSASKK